jgi:hypothetical protein
MIASMTTVIIELLLLLIVVDYGGEPAWRVAHPLG